MSKLGMNIDRKALIKKAKEVTPIKKNVTFRLDEELYDDFLAICKTEKVKAIAIIEAFLTEFVDKK